MHLEYLIDKEFILSRVSEVDIFEHYLGVTVREGDRYCNTLPGRDKIDRNPGCCFFFTDSGRLIFKDFAWRAFDCFDVVMQQRGVGFQKALEIIAFDFGINNSLTIPKYQIRNYTFTTSKVRREYTPIQIKRKVWSKKELEFWQFPDMEITVEMLERSRIFSISHYWFNGYIKGYDLKNVFAFHFGKDKFQIYQPFSRNRSYRFRQSSSSWIIGFADLRKGEPVLLTKSYKDLCTLRWLGFNAVCTLTEGKPISEEEMKLLREYGEVTLLYDRDEKGIQASEEISNQHNCNYILYPEDWGTKDTFDSCKKLGTQPVKAFLEEVLETS